MGVLEEWLSLPLGPRQVALVEAYLEVADKEGVEAVTFQKVAKAAGVAYGTVHYHFGKSEEALHDAAFRYVARTSGEYLETALTQAGQDADLLRVYLDTKFQWNRKYRTYANIWAYFLYMAGRDPRYREIAVAMERLTVSRLEGLVLMEVGKGRYPRPRDSAGVAAQIYQLIFGGYFLSQVVDGPKEAASRRSRTWKAVVTLLRGEG